MDVSDRTWWIRIGDGAAEGPISEEEFQDRLRAGEVPLGAEIRSDRMDGFRPLLEVVSSDESFQRPSTMPPPPPRIPD